MAHVLLCLRGNVTLAGDLALADRELSALLPDVSLRRSPVAEVWPAFAARLYLLHTGQAPAPARDVPLATDAAYVGELSAAQFGCLLDRATFLQQLFALPDEVEQPAFAALAAAAPRLRGLSGPVFVALTAQCLTEIASLAAAKAHTGQAGPALAGTIEALLGEPGGERERVHAAALARRPRASSYLTHDLHVYKAKFFPRMARAALNLVACDPGPVGLLLDPFAGSGTALLEASRLGIASLGTDIDPLSVLIANAKLLLPAVDLAALKEPLEDGTFERAAGEAKSGLRFPAWLARKLTPEQAQELLGDAAALAAAIGGLPAGVERTLARICLSDALTRKLHMRFLGTGVGRFALEVRRPALRTLFLARYAALCREAALCRNVLPTYGLQVAASAAAARGDAHALPLASGSVGAVLTSPPYLPASSGRENYLMSKAPSLLVLGLLDASGVEALNRNATGSMSSAAGAALPAVAAGFAAAGKRASACASAGLELSGEERRLVDWLAADPLRSIKAEPVQRYFRDLRGALLELGRVLRPGGRAAIVMGTRSTFYRFSTREPIYTVETAALFAEAAVSLGFAVDELIEVELDKGNRNARPRSLDGYSETVVIVRS